MSAFKNYFDGIDTTADMAAECGEIRSKAAKIRKRRKIATSSLGVTLAVMMTTTVAASAAGGWNITEIIGRWFNGNTDSITDNLSVVTAENAENQFEFLDISPNGSVIDDNMIIFFLDVTRNDGGIFDCEVQPITIEDGSIYYDPDGNTFPSRPWYNFHTNSNDGIKFVVNVTESNGFNYDAHLGVASRQYLVDDDNPTDNKMTIALCCDINSIKSQLSEDKKMIIGSEAVGAGELNSYTIKSVKLKLGTLEGRKDFILYRIEAADSYFVGDFSSEFITGNWEGELMIDIKPSKTVTFEPNMASTFLVNNGKLNEDGILETFGYSFNVEKITLSQMSISFEMTGEAPEEHRYLEDLRIGEIIMKNGNTIVLQPDSLVPGLYSNRGFANEYLPDFMKSTEWRVRGSVMLTEPIDPDDVAAVRLGDTTFPVK